MSQLSRSTSEPHSFGWLAWFRPMFVASLVLHGVVLSVPILSDPQPPPEEEEATVELTQLPPLVSLKTPPTPQPKPIAPTPQPVQQAVPLPPRPQAPPPVQSSVPPVVSPAPVEPGVEESVSEVAPPPEDAALSAEDQELQDYFAQLQGDLQGVAADETAGLSIPYYLFETPQLFFTAESLAAAEADTTLAAIPIDGVDNILWASRRRPADLLSELQGRFEGFTFSETGNFGGGVLYKLEKGDTVRYLNLVRATDRTATFVVIWNRDPKEPVSSAESQSVVP